MSTRKMLLTVVTPLVIVIGGILTVRHLHQLQSSPQPSTSSLRQLSIDVGHNLRVTAMTSLDVVEKPFYVNVSASVTGFSHPPLLRPTATELNKSGFHTYLLDEGRRAVLCKGETVVEIQSFPAAGADPAKASVSVTWGTGSTICR